MPAAVMLLSVLTALVSGWITSMFLLLRHPHYLERATLGVLVVAGASAMAAGGWRGPIALRAALGVWAVALLALGVWALLGDSGDDGWILLAGCLFAAEGATSAICVLRRRRIA